VTKGLLQLVGGTLLCWLVVVVPARWLWGDSALLFSTTAWLLCLVPSAGTLAWAQWALRGKPEQQLLAVMGGTVVRMLFVLGIGMALYLTLPDFQYIRFWLWVIAFYFITLTLEIVLVTRQSAQSSTQG
jgi:hypothetical protein